MLEARKATIGYNGQPVLREVDLVVARGQFFGVVGPNGCGKSTLVRALSRVLPPISGQVLLDGIDVYEMGARELARRLAVVAQDNTVAFDFPVREIVLMGRSPHLSRLAVEGPRDYAAAQEAMALTHTLPFADRAITSLSGGERQRCMIARALAQQPDVLVLDEPTAHLDINHQIEILDLARRLTSERGLATLVVLHDLNLASQYCDQLILIAQGRVSASGAPAEVVTESRIRGAYGADVQVRLHPSTGRPYVTLISRLPVGAQPTRQTRLHLICGAGTGVRLMRRLRQLGFPVSVGAVNVADTDQLEAEALDLPRVEEAPFSPIAEETHRLNCEMARESDVVVVTGIPYGRGNLPNLEAAVRARGIGRRVLVIDDPPIPGRDFTDGEATALQRQLINAGAELCRDEADALARLEALP
ncbi:MAG: heme ABC transporter ATP-binding protein [Armatimonadota bacterium]